MQTTQTSQSAQTVPTSQSAQTAHWLADALAVRAGCVDRSVIDAALVGISRLIAVLESQRLVCASALRQLSPVPQRDLAVGPWLDGRDASSVLDRAGVAQRVPAFGAALALGELSAAHLDRLGGAIRRLGHAQRGRFVQRADELVDVARDTTPAEFATHLRQVERELDADDGMAMLARQQAGVRLRTWVGPDDGMHYWQLAMDPETAVSATSRLGAAADALFHAGGMPAGAPIDLRERESFLRGHALIGLITGPGGRHGGGRPEYIIVEDRRYRDGPRIDPGIPVELPGSVVAAMRARARQVTVVLDGGSVVGAPGVLNLGRTARLARPAQRRVLRACYATCAVPGCTVPFGDCTIHHVTWWRWGGLTNLDNLVPVCWSHHAQMHSGQWRVTLAADRAITIHLPDGTTLCGTANRHMSAEVSERIGRAHGSHGPAP